MSAGEPRHGPAAMLEAAGISKSYDGNPALADVSFRAAAGRMLALCGENGAGKSTLMKVLPAAVTPDAGKVRLDGRPVRIVDPHHAIRLGIHTVHQELSLLPHLSVAEKILLGRMPHGRRASWLIDWKATNETAAAAPAGQGRAGPAVQPASGRA